MLRGTVDWGLFYSFSSPLSLHMPTPMLIGSVVLIYDVLILNGAWCLAHVWFVKSLESEVLHTYPLLRMNVILWSLLLVSLFGCVNFLQNLVYQLWKPLPSLQIIHHQCCSSCQQSPFSWTHNAHWGRLPSHSGTCFFSYTTTSTSSLPVLVGWHFRWTYGRSSSWLSHSHKKFDVLSHQFEGSVET